MKIKKLEIFGFKSFAQRQNINFQDGITAVVGPNGCGKSNVVDAIRWVMGEQNARHLRGSQMQDIIFCGSKKKSALSFAEVTLTIDNEQKNAPVEYNHYSEIEISRRLFKTGESEYEINKQRCRLRDISDFFLGTGVGVKAYSIIEQGKVNELISAKPEERRIIIEEAAGITKYKAKKNLAQRSLDKTKDNITRIEDIKREVDKRVEELFLEKEKLLEVTKIKDEIKNLDLHSTSHLFLKSSCQLNFQRRSKESLQKEIINFEKEKKILEISFEEILDKTSKKSEEKRLIEDLLLEHKSSLELSSKDIEHTKENIQETKHNLEKIKNQIESLENNKAQNEIFLQKLKEDEEEVQINLKEQNNLFQIEKEKGESIVLQRKEILAKEKSLQQNLIESAKNASMYKAQVSAEKEKEEQKKKDLIAIDKDILEKEKESVHFNESLELLRSEIEKALKKEANLKEDLKNLNDKTNESHQKLDKQKREDFKLTDEKRTKTARLNSLKEVHNSFSWSQSGISDLMKSEHKNQISSIMADAIIIKDEGRDIFERCLFHLLDTALVKTPKDFLQLSSALKNKKSLTTSFFINDNSSEQESLPKYLNLPSLKDFVEIKDQNLFKLKNLFARYFIAKDLQEAFSFYEKAKQQNVFIITKDFELLNPDGTATVYLPKNNSGVLKRKSELAKLDEELLALEPMIIKSANLIREGQRLLQEQKHKKSNLYNELNPLSQGLIKSKESLRQREIIFKRNNHELEKLIGKKSFLSGQSSVSKDQIAKLKQLWSDSLMEHKETEEKINDFKEEQSFIEDNFTQYNKKLNIIQIEKAKLKEKLSSLGLALSQGIKNQDMVIKQISDLDEDVLEKEKKILFNEETLRQSQKKSQTLISEIESTEKQSFAIKEIFAKLLAEKEVRELELGKMQKALAKLKDQDFKTDSLKRELEQEINFLAERIFEKYNLNLHEELSDFHYLPPLEKGSKQKIEKLKKELGFMGAVNENANQEYIDYSTRKTFLHEQLLDLNEAVAQLESAIVKINETSKLRFKEAFDKINEKFKIVFPRLFNGGEAKLSLSGSDDLLLCGVDIMAKPPGKNISSIELMSGGEKALTAISLIMAIFLIKPSPFCLLDEVDAPLDEANVSRFSQLVREMSQLSQFIVITHNRKTMEAADKLYGVTMEDQGASKIVSVQVKDAYESIKDTNEASHKEKPKQLFLDEIV